MRRQKPSSSHQYLSGSSRGARRERLYVNITRVISYLSCCVAGEMMTAAQGGRRHLTVARKR